jgi:CDGSH-type Zn-finger protein
MTDDVIITVRENGPYLVSGPITIKDADGNVYPAPQGSAVALCRCGGSTTKPFCDGTHSKTGFAAAERAVAAESDE